MKQTTISNPMEAGDLTQEAVDVVQASIGAFWARQAIETRYCGPTNVRGSRYKATCVRGSITVGADDSLNPDQNHVAAARALVEKFVDEDAAKYGTTGVNLWAMPFVSGGLPNGDYCHVFLPRELVGLVAKGVSA